MGNQLRSCCKNEDNIDNKLKEDNKEENDDLETGSNNGEDNDIKDMFNTSPKTDNSNYIATSSIFSNQNYMTDISNDTLYYSYELGYTHNNYIINRTFNRYVNAILNSKLEELMIKEEKFHKENNSNINFQIEGIIERDSHLKENLGSNNNSSEGSVGSFSGSSLNVSSSSFNFLIITNIDIYDFEFSFQNNELKLRRKISLKEITFISLSTDNTKMIIHIDKGRNIYIFSENCEHISFCLCHIIYQTLNKKIISIIPIPQSISFYEMIRKANSFNDIKAIYNDYIKKNEILLKKSLLLDENENIIKFSSILKIEHKFISTKEERYLYITNKKLIELSNMDIEKAKVDILPFNKIKKINECSKESKLQIVTTDKNSLIQYGTLVYEKIIRTLYTAHSQDFYYNFEVNNIN